MKSGSTGFIPEQTSEVYNEVWLTGCFRSRRVKCIMKSGSTGFFRSRRVKCIMKSGSTGLLPEQTSEVYNEVWLNGVASGADE
ncbi:hypothetical protein JTB14_026848 [Gonioctena quinquepunctata]|nr:hypothetical protein JTB14_026848 [Gonioctena quinquepunctata]